MPIVRRSSGGVFALLPSHLHLRPIAVTLIGVVAITGCSVGFKYAYEGHEYTMTRGNINYQKKVLADVQQKYGIFIGHAQVLRLPTLPELQKQAITFKGACDYMQASLTESPEGSGFTPASDLLRRDSAEVCQSASAAAHELQRKEAEEALAIDVARARKRAIEDEAMAEAAEKKSQAIAAIVQECTSHWLSQSDKCVGVHGISAAEVVDCQKRCTDGGANGYKAALSSAQTSCSTAKIPPKCDVTRPTSAVVDDAQFKGDLAACAKGCGDDRKAAAAAAREQAAAAREAAAACARTPRLPNGTPADSCHSRCLDVGLKCAGYCSDDDTACAANCKGVMRMCSSNCPCR